jgi:hypothetical protein
LLRDYEFSSPLVLIQPLEHRLEDDKLRKSKARPADGYSMLFFEAIIAELSPNGMQASNLRAIKYLEATLVLIEAAINQN